MNTDLALVTRSLTKQFDRHVAVNGVDLQIGSGEVYGLIGPNGAGKTTLIRMLATADEPTAGEIYLHGERLLRGDNNSRLKRYLGYLPDNYPLYEELTVWDYLDYFAGLYYLPQPHRRRRLYYVLELVGLTNKYRSPISTLSRGMKQRLGLARTIVHEPIVLLLDEPVSGLDPVARTRFREIVRVLRDAGMTIVISSHVLSDLAELCTSIGIMEFGHLVESAPLSELYSRLADPYISIRSLGTPERVEDALKESPLVKGWEKLPEANRWRVRFSGGEEESAELLRSLVSSGIAITEFNPTREDLESIFLKLGHQQAT